MTIQLALTTDGVIVINGSKDNILKNAVLQSATLSIADLGISTGKLATTAVTTEKVADKAILIEKLGNTDKQAGKILITDDKGGFVFTTVEAEKNDGQHLTTDGIIGFSNPNGGKNAVLVETGLKINENSITKSKLNSEAELSDMLLVTNGEGGFDYVLKEAVQAGGVDMNLGTSLEFINGTNGLNSVLADTAIDVKKEGITTSKIANSAIDISKMNSIVKDVKQAKGLVLAADGVGNVQFENVENLIVENGKELTSDGSLTVAANNKALLQGLSIGIASQGVNTTHIADASVNVLKMNSIVAGKNVVNGSVLTADGKGKVGYSAVNDIVFGDGKALTADGAIYVKTGSKALLKAASIGINPAGIKNKHIDANAVTADKIGSRDSSADFVLVADGNGGTLFKNATKVSFKTGKTLSSEGTIKVGNGEDAVLKDVSIDIADLGITNRKIADKTITVSKIDGEESAEGAVLSSLGDGEVKFVPLSTYGSKLSSTDSSLEIKGGDKAVLNATFIQIKTGGVLTKHIGDNQVTTSKLSSKKATGNESANSVLTADGSGGVGYKSFDNLVAKGNLISDNAIQITNGTDALLKNVSISINNLGIEEGHIATHAVSVDKLGSEGIGADFVGVTNAGGGVDYKKVTDLIANNTYDLKLVGALDFGAGTTGVDAVRQPVTMMIKQSGIIENLIADNAVTTNKIAANNVTTSKIKDAAIETNKVADQAITSEKINSTGSKEGAILVSDGADGAEFKEVNSMMPKFFYLPAVYLPIVSGGTGELNIYQKYSDQFSAPMVSNDGAGIKPSLPVIANTKLNYHITYYDTDVFYEVKVSNNGVMTYKMKAGVQPTGKTFFNIVLEVK